MGQITRKEIVGLLQRTSGANVTLGPSVLNIGGQQYSIASNLLMNISLSGFGGLDTGSVAASTTYHLYAVVNNSGVPGLVSSLTLPTAGGPTGFPIWRYLWSIHTDQSSLILDFQRVGKKNVFINSLDGITTNPDFTANNPALLIDFGSPWTAGTSTSNNATFTNAMLNGIADQFEGVFFFVGDGGAAGNRARLYSGGPSGSQGNIAALGAYISGVGVLFTAPYVGTVGASYSIELVSTLAERDLVNKILSYDNKLVDESSSAGTVVQIGTPIVAPKNELWLKDANGYGSTNLYQKRWSTIAVNDGTAFTYTDSPTLGTTITINEDGLYAMSMTEETNSNSQFGMTVNQSNPAQPLTSIVNGLEVLAAHYTTSASLFMTTTAVKFLHAGDIIRTLSDAAGPGPYPQVVGFRIEKIAISGVSGVASVGPRSEVFVYGGNGHGSVDTFVRRFTTLASSSGTDITFTDNASNGSFFTINTPGIYSITYEDASSAGASAGITRNCPNLTTPVSDPSNDAYRLVSTTVSGAAASQPAAITVCTFCNIGDVIRAQNDSASTPNGTTNNGTNFRITKINN